MDMKYFTINRIVLVPICLILLGIFASCNQKENLSMATPEIIPIPVECNAHQSGQAFTLDQSTVIQVSGAIEKGNEIAGYLTSLVEKSAGFSPEVLLTDKKPSRNSILIEIGDYPDLPDEGYHLTVNKKGINISGSTCISLRVFIPKKHCFIYAVIRKRILML